MSYTQKEIKELREKYKELKNTHEKIREILMDYKCVEFGDCIIDEICNVVGIDDTTVYYEE